MRRNKARLSQAMIPIRNKKVKLEPEEKEKFTVLKSNDPKAQILYQELEFGNYMLFTEEDLDKQIDGSQRKKVYNEKKRCIRHLDT